MATTIVEDLWHDSNHYAPESDKETLAITMKSRNNGKAAANVIYPGFSSEPEGIIEVDDSRIVDKGITKAKDKRAAVHVSRKVGFC